MVVCINEQPDYKEVYENIKAGNIPSSKAAFERTVKYGEERVLKGYLFLGTNGKPATRHGYYLFKDAEDNYKEKMLNIRNLNWFAYNNLYVHKEYKNTINLD